MHGRFWFFLVSKLCHYYNVLYCDLNTVVQNTKCFNNHSHPPEVVPTGFSMLIMVRMQSAGRLSVAGTTIANPGLADDVIPSSMTLSLAAFNSSPRSPCDALQAESSYRRNACVSAGLVLLLLRELPLQTAMSSKASLLSFHSSNVSS